MECHHGSSQPSEISHPCLWHTHHLTLHGLRQVLDLRHGYPMCQLHEVDMNALEHLLHMHTCNFISSSPPSMMREAFRPPWSSICIHMIGCHYVLSHKNMSFLFHISKNTKKINNSKILKIGLGFVTNVTICRSWW